MATSKPTTVAEYLASLPDDRRTAIEAVRKTILANLDKGYAEGIQYGMIGYFVPHSVYPPGYHCDPKQPLPFASIASQKNHIGIYLFCIYNDAGETAEFVKAWKATGKKLDMGKSCIRFKKIEDVALDVIGNTIRRMPAKKFIEYYERNIKAAGTRSSSSKSKKTTTRKPATKKPATKKSAKKPSTKKSSPAASKKTTSRKKAARSKRG